MQSQNKTTYLKPKSIKFKSRRDIFFTITIYGMIIFLIVMLIIVLTDDVIDGEEIFACLTILGTIGLLIWMFHGTKYELTESHLKYQSGPIKGKIKIDRIKEIVKGKNLWVGLKPATSMKGLIIKYNKYNEIYISPKTNDLFIEKILEINSEIKIITKTKNV